MENYLNRYLTIEDFNYAEQRRDSENLADRYPHRDLWYKTDAVMKWLSIIRTFELIVSKNNKKVVDLGSGEAPICHYIADLGNEVVGVDIGSVDHLVKQSLVKMILKDAWVFLEEQKDESVDVFLDSCAVTHFGSHGKSYSNQWESCFERVYRVLKTGGYFIISTDVEPKSEVGEFISPQKIISYAENYGLSLVGNSDFTDQNPYIPEGYPYPVAHIVFKK